MMENIMNKIKMYDGITLDMSTSEVIEHGEVSYVDASEVAFAGSCNKGKGGSKGSYTTATITDIEAGDTLVVTIGGGGSRGGQYRKCCGYDTCRSRGGSGGSGIVRTEVIS